MLLGGIGFKNRTAIDRVTRGVRYAEGMMMGADANYPNQLPGSSGAPSAHVLITAEAVDGFYGGVYVYRNLESSDSTDTWLTFDRPGTVVEEVNGNSLTVGLRYPCEVVGIFELLDGFDVPTTTWYNGYPLAIVSENLIDGQPNLGPRRSCDGGWVAGLKTTDCLVATLVCRQGDCATIPYQQIPLTYDGGEVGWLSEPDAFIETGTGGTGTVKFFQTWPTPQAEIDDQPGISLGPDGGGGWLFAFGGPVLCGGSPLTCENYFVVKFECQPCEVSSGGYGGTSTLTIPTGTIQQFTINVPPTSGPLKTFHLRITSPCPDGIRNLRVVLRAPDGTVYQILDRPPYLTAQTGDFVFDPTAPTNIQSLVWPTGSTAYGIYQPIDDFTTHTGVNFGNWQVIIQNFGPCDAGLVDATLCLGTPDSGLALSISASPDTGASPLTTSLTITPTGTPTMYSIDWGDGSPIEYTGTPSGHVHTYTSDGSYEIAVRAYGVCGTYIEDTYIVTVGVFPGCADAPSVMTATFVAANACMNGFVTTVTSVSSSEWDGDGVPVACAPDSGIVLECLSDVWTLEYDGASGWTLTSSTSTTLVFTATITIPFRQTIGDTITISI